MSKLFFKKDKGCSNINNNNNLNSSNKKDFSERKAKLSPLEFKVTQGRETERPFSNKYYKHWETGSYHCKVCGAELFTSSTKFESKSGWPAFYNVVDPKRVRLTADLSHVGANLLLLIAKPDLARTEVSCANCNAHLGHLFKDGPKPTGLRYCINSASLDFISGENDGSDGSGSGSQSPDELVNGVPEFPCNPENVCNMPSYPNPVHTKNDKSLTLPPVGALCLRGTPSPCQKKKKELSQSVETFDTCSRSTTTTTPTRTTPISNNNNGSGDPSPSSLSEESRIFEKCTSYKKTASAEENRNTSAQEPRRLPFTRSSSVRYSSSKGASLTAARIQFFQNLSSQTPSQSYNAPPPNRPFVNRFVNSSSSGSIGIRKNSKEVESNGDMDIPNGIGNGRRGSGQFGFGISTQISAAPVPLKETEL